MQNKTLNKKDLSNTLFTEKQRKRKKLERELPLHLMMLVPMYFIVIFNFGSLLGLVMAFQDYLPGQGWFVFGSEIVGFENFARLFNDPEIWQILINTIVIALLKIFFGTLFPILVAILLNEVSITGVKRGVQTLIFLPYFISWVILAGVFAKLFSTDGGVLNTMFAKIGVTLPDFLGDPKHFRSIIVVSDIWKGAGYSVIIFLAAITNIDPSLYEAAKIDGAGYVRQCFAVTIPGMMTVIVLMTILNMGNILNAGFEQVYNLYSDMVYSTGDILDTFIYRTAFEGAMDYSLSTAATLFKSVVSFIFVSVTYVIAYKKFDYKVF